MTTATRYAIYYAPPEGSSLARFGASWFGWDIAAGAPVAHPQVGIDVAALTRNARKYGFHGTLKPPFRLADGTTQAGLEAAVSALARRVAPFDMAPLALRPLGGFLALVPSVPSPPLEALARHAVETLDPFRAPAESAELARRRAAGLTPRQESLLQRWGYPYVAEEFRFHLTLTGHLDPVEIEQVIDVLSRLTQPFFNDPLAVTEICLCVETPSGQFQILHRYPLTG